MYLLLIVSGGVGYYSGAALIVDGDPAATARNVLSAESLWRVGFAAMLAMLVCDVVVALLFYVLFEPTSRTVSLLAMAFRLVMTAVLAVNLFTRSGTLLLLRDGAGALDADQRQMLALLALEHFDRGFNIALVFFGGCCLAIGWLILRSTFLPRVLGVLLTVAGLCYLTNSVADILGVGRLMRVDVLPVAYLAEVALSLWLVTVGVNAETWHRDQRGPVTAGRP